MPTLKFEEQVAASLDASKSRLCGETQTAATWPGRRSEHEKYAPSTLAGLPLGYGSPCCASEHRMAQG